ncbi:MAG: Nramp family divalent metal transporter [Calditrichaceae bacterium]|nr:Nramp family divalent metal transporter [Calditrichia bacterium]NUQ42157.1 Nramp family divalent metal transporter [Calditrichaceae bacterium]
MKRNLRENLKMIGPGAAVAATGVGAGDMIAAAVAGAKYGEAILWAAIFGAVIKFVLNEGIARWQLATGETLLEGWADKLGAGVSSGFIIYLVLWSFIVAAALIAACGLAAHAMFPQLPLIAWGAIHSLAAVVLIFLGRYRLFEALMKGFIALMFVTILACAAWIKPDWAALLPALATPNIPKGSGKFILGVIGGVGGSVTLLNYSYWIREKKWEGRSFHRPVIFDLGTAYLLTGLFGAAMIIVSAGLHPDMITEQNQMALALANRMETVLGAPGKWAFLIGFWGAVFTSLLGVWQGIPYLFADFMQLRRGKKTSSRPAEAGSGSWYYKGYLLYLAFPPVLLLLFKKPVWLVVIYSITSAFFMPFLALALLYMNNRRDWVGELRNRWYINLLLTVSLLLFGYLCAVEIAELF